MQKTIISIYQKTKQGSLTQFLINIGKVNSE
jgi:hypothetical protein